MKHLRILALVLALGGSLFGGRIVVNHDEWTLSNTGYANAGAANADQFAKNVAAFLTGVSGGKKILIFSNNFGLVESNLQASLAGAGYTVTLSTALPFTLPNLLGFDAVFMAGQTPLPDTTVLTNYVNSGRGLLVEGGTGQFGGAAGEAAAWNPLLNAFGFQFGSPYNGFTGNDTVTGSHPILTGVGQLYYNNGNPLSLFGGVSGASLVEFNANGLPLLGVFDSTTSGVPEPGSVTLLGAGIAGLWFFARRRR